MRENRIKAARLVHPELLSAENSIDAAIRGAATLTLKMLEARNVGRFGLEVGQAALGHVGSTLAMLINARREMVDAHGQFQETRIRLGLGQTSIGDEDDKGDREKKAAQQVAPLHLVA